MKERTDEIQVFSSEVMRCWREGVSCTEVSFSGMRINLAIALLVEWLIKHPVDLI